MPACCFGWSHDQYHKIIDLDLEIKSKWLIEKLKIFKVSCSSKLYRTRISSFSIKDTKFTIAITNCFCIIISTLLTYTYLLKLPSNVPKNVINNQFIWDKSMRYKTLLSIRKIVISYKYTFCKFTFWFSYIQLISKFLLQRKKSFQKLFALISPSEKCFYFVIQLKW